VLLPSTIGYPFTESLLVETSTVALGLAHLFYLVLFIIAVVLSLAGLLGYKKQFFQLETKSGKTNRVNQT
jgi:hypothetical protein